MKKRIIGILASLFFVMTAAAALLVVNASAAPAYNLWIGGDRVTSDNLSGSGWRFEPDTNTLVLNGFGLATWGYNVGKDPLGHYPEKVKPVCHHLCREHGSDHPHGGDGEPNRRPRFGKPVI